MDKLSTALAIYASIGDMYYLDRSPKKRKRQEKQCLHCGEDHTHNNSFCSAKCCKEYRSSKSQ